MTKDSLRGLKSACTVVQIGSVLEQLGVQTKRIKEDTEMRLRRSGLTISSCNSGEKSKVDAGILVDVSGTKADTVVGVSTTVSVLQEATLVRDATKSMPTITWQKHSVSVYGKSVIKEIRDIVSDAIDSLVSSLKEVNPQGTKKQGSDS